MLGAELGRVVVADGGMGVTGSEEGECAGSPGLPVALLASITARKEKGKEEKGRGISESVMEM